VFPAVPEGAPVSGFASGEPATPGKDPFPGRIRRHSPRQTSAVIEICSALHAPYPAGDGQLQQMQYRRLTFYDQNRLSVFLHGSSYAYPIPF